MTSDRSTNLSLKYQRFTPLVCIDIGIRKFEFVSKTQFLSTKNRKKSLLYIKKLFIQKFMIYKTYKIYMK